MRHASERLLYGDVLERDGFATTRVATIDDARAAASKALPEILLLGLDDLAQDEFEFVRWVKQVACPVRILGVTASPHGLGIGAMAGCDDCVQIPVSMAQIMSIIHRLTPIVTSAA